ncbi:hypothetical protein M427DRAFT_46510 [Gonapodya prolifera JEL478]|uniref:MOSC domain-containing protein n=1 Tax=Gonapodya prolifera (strain JEL478) TaxID=1344416 RepID=A0A139A625_GONPJ|nr:hypothetical protein M427DRAFT_46510 [Gonapodya prolifera JEL478]|eukprot:KXS12252.1 hypothetical protein M427DRAFT_46510 [Gonapodya prolifera JEL478]
MAQTFLSDGALLAVTAIGAAFVTWLTVETAVKSWRRRPVKVVALTTYPIKSCGGIRLRRSRLTAAGLPFDRHWTLVDLSAQDGTNQLPRFVTAREFPSLVTLKVGLEFDDGTVEQDAGLKDYSSSAGWLVVQGNGMSKELRVRFPKKIATAASSVQFTLWDDSVQGFDEGDEAAQWFLEYLTKSGGPKKIKGTNLRLMVKTYPRNSRCRVNNQDPSFVRPTDPKYPPPREPTHIDQSLFADGYPYLVLSTASVLKIVEIGGALNSEQNMVERALSESRRYRPNILVDSDEPYEEDKWAEFSVESSGSKGGHATMYGVKLCSRCQIPAINPETGLPATGSYPLRTLMSNRRGLIAGKPYQSVMGMNTVLGAGEGSVVEVGAKITVSDRRKVKGAA